jgi:hypothetical protein
VAHVVSATDNAVSLSGMGVDLSTANSDVTSGTGNVTVDAGTGLFNMAANSSIITSGNVTAAADTIALAGLIQATGGASEVKLAPDSSGVAINLGAGAAAGFALSDAELNTIEAPIVRIGDGTGAAPFGAATDSAITFVGAFTSDASFATNFLELQTTSTVAATAAALDLSAGTTDLAVRAGSTVNIANAGHDLQTVAVTTGPSASAVTLLEGPTGMSVGTVDSIDGVVTGGGQVDITSGGLLTVAHQVNNTGANAINLTGVGVDLSTPDSDVGATTGGVVTVDGNAGNLNMAAGSSIATTSTSDPAIGLVADTMSLGGTVTAGGVGAVVRVRPDTGARSVELGVGALNNLALTDAELNTIAADRVRIGDAATGAINFTGNFTSNATFADDFLALQTNNANVTQVGGSAIDLGLGTSDLVVRAGNGAVTLDQAGNDFTNVAVSTTGAVSLRDTNALTVGTVDTVPGITGTAGVTLEGGGLLTLNEDVSTAANQAISLTGNGVTVDAGASSVDAGSGLVTVDAGAGTFTILAGAEVLTTDLPGLRRR